MSRIWKKKNTTWVSQEIQTHQPFLLRLEEGLCQSTQGKIEYDTVLIEFFNSIEPQIGGCGEWPLLALSTYGLKAVHQASTCDRIVWKWAHVKHWNPIWIYSKELCWKRFKNKFVTSLIHLNCLNRCIKPPPIFLSFPLGRPCENKAVKSATIRRPFRKSRLYPLCLDFTYSYLEISNQLDWSYSNSDHNVRGRILLHYFKFRTELTSYF